MVLAAFNKFTQICAALIASAASISAQENATTMPLPWHLQGCSDKEACLDIQPVWARFSAGDSQTTVLFMESNLYRDTRTAAFGHAGLDAGRLEILAVNDDVRFAAPADGITTILANLEQLQTVAADLFGKAAPGVKAALVPEIRDQFCTFVSRSMTEERNHDLQMAALVGGLQLPGVSGVAPGVNLALHNGSIEMDFALGKEANELSEILPQRPDIRVINVSQESLDSSEPHWAQYQRLRDFAMRVGARTPSSQDLRSRVLVVAAAGNRSNTYSTRYSVDTSLDYRIPNEAIHIRLATQENALIDLSPNTPELSKGAVPIVVVGAILHDRSFPTFGRLDPGIDLLAPSGAIWSPELANDNRLEAVSPANWQDCLCATVFQRQTGSVSLPASAHKECAPLAELPGLDRLLGVPVVDFHSESRFLTAHNGDRRLCGTNPAGVCQSATAGTSGAAALVSGIAALMFSLDPTLSGEEVADILTTTAINNSRDGLPVVSPMMAMHSVQVRMIDGVLAALSREDLDWLDQRIADIVRVTDQGRKSVSRSNRDSALNYLIEAYGRSQWQVLRILDTSLADCPTGVLGDPGKIGRELAKVRPCTPPGSKLNALYQIAELTDGTTTRTAHFIWTREVSLDRVWRLAGLQLGGIKIGID